jgi:hypothetical protein
MGAVPNRRTLGWRSVRQGGKIWLKQRLTALQSDVGKRLEQALSPRGTFVIASSAFPWPRLLLPCYLFAASASRGDERTSTTCFVLLAAVFY